MHPSSPDPVNAHVAPGKPNFLYIDCLRGYAIFLVIVCHTAYAYPELPYPIQRVFVLGWHGVQLFFLASAITLLLQWEHEMRTHGSVRIFFFYLRRFFRIAPAYYLAGALYYVLAPPNSGFDVWQLAASYTFINVWHPLLTPTEPGRWMVVPGGWSIGVEFTFYAAFPVVVAWARTLKRSVAFVAASYVGALFANAAAMHLLAGSTSGVPLSNFLYFWFPNQLPVFAVGTLLYRLICGMSRSATCTALAARFGSPLALASGLTFAAVGFLPLTQRIDGLFPYIPTFLLECIPLSSFVLALALSRRNIFVNRPFAAIGKVSFSAYLLHFAVIQVLIDAHPAFFYTQATRYNAIAAFSLGVVVVLLGTFAISLLTHRWIERSGIELGKCVINMISPDALRNKSASVA